MTAFKLDLIFDIVTMTLGDAVTENFHVLYAPSNDAHELSSIEMTVTKDGDDVDINNTHAIIDARCETELLVTFKSRVTYSHSRQRPCRESCAQTTRAS